MRNLSLSLILAITAFMALDFAQASYLGEPFHTAHPSLAEHEMDRSAAAMPGDAEGMGYYIVRLKDAPAALYKGGIAGYAATNARANGRRILDAFAPSTRVYVNYLQSRQSELLLNAERLLNRPLSPRYTYSYALNGMSLKLTRAEASRLGRLDGVAAVEPVRYYKPDIGSPPTSADTNDSRTWIDAPGIWDASPGTEGEGIVVADVDTGINDANSSFAATGPLDGYVAVNPLGTGNFLGVCDPANSSQHSKKPSFFACNDKLIGAYTYTSGTNDPNSPEDSEGHGSHTASTMVGDFLSIPVNGVSTPLSGVAPHASLIAYDVCDPTNLCSTSASAEAVDQAIQDQTTLQGANQGFKGMVLNYSIGGGSDPYDDSVEQAFLSAVEAGIFVAVSGGNGGPANAIDNDPANFPQYPVEHLAPWVATVAASTHDGVFGPDDVETFSGGDSATLGRLPAIISGVSENGGLGPENAVYAGDGTHIYAPYPGSFSVTSVYPLSGQHYPDPTNFSAVLAAQECLYPFPPHSFPANTIVVCDRGDIPLIDKADNVKQGGAAGIVIVSQSSDALIAEAYEIPGTMVDNADGVKLEAWLKASVGIVPAAQAQLSGAALTTDTSQADQVAGFSSRGPTGTVFDDLIKPDLTAPGVSVLAALSNPAYTAATPGGSHTPDTFGFLDGTSMAAPHVTASAALLMALHTNWTPAEIRSALMLTSVTSGVIDQCASLDSGENCIAGNALPSPQVRGAGRIDVETADRTGLLLDENGNDYTNADPQAPHGDLTELNLPSLANADCVTGCSWSRIFTSPFSRVSVPYTLSVTGLTSGLRVAVTPSSFTLGPGSTQQINVTADTSSVPSGTWAFAEIDIAAGAGAVGDGGAAVAPMHMPLAVQSIGPAAHMSVNSYGLTFTVNPFGNLFSESNPIQTEPITISNDGQLPLSWKAVFSAQHTSQSSMAPAMGAQAPLSIPIANQELAASTSGFPSDFFSPNNHGIYSSDTFTMPVDGTISTITTPGFMLSSRGGAQLTGGINWYIYRDSSGAPAGNPDDGKQDYVWHYAGDAAGSGIGVLNGTISLDLASAHQPPIELDTGTYWLIVSGISGSKATDATPTAWFWFQSGFTYGEKARIIDPANLLGNGSNWEPLLTSFAFTLTGTLDCSNGGVEDFSLNHMSGDVKAGGTESVVATFDGTHLSAGTYSGVLCLSSNASDNPLIVLPVSATIDGTTGPGTGKSGGGGGFGWFALAGLALAARRRLDRRH